MKRIIQKQLPLLGVIILLAVVATYLVKSDMKVVRETILEEILPKEGLVIKGFQYNQENPDKGVTWALDAGEMRSSGDNNLISFQQFRLKLRAKDRPAFDLTGEQGSYSRDSGEITLHGNLEGISEDGYRLVTDQIRINEKNGHLRTDRPIKISGPFFSIKGLGLFVDLEKETLKILSAVTATLKTEHLTQCKA